MSSNFFLLYKIQIRMFVQVRQFFLVITIFVKIQYFFTNNNKYILHGQAKYLETPLGLKLKTFLRISSTNFIYLFVRYFSQLLNQSNNRTDTRDCRIIWYEKLSLNYVYTLQWIHSLFQHWIKANIRMCMESINILSVRLYNCTKRWCLNHNMWIQNQLLKNIK